MFVVSFSILTLVMDASSLARVDDPAQQNRAVSDVRGVLGLLQDAHRMSLAQYEHGRLTIDCSRSDGRPGGAVRTATCDVQWEAGRIRVTASRQEQFSSLAKDPAHRAGSRDQSEVILRGSDVTLLSAGAGRVSTWSITKEAAPEGTFLRPEDLWFGKVEGGANFASLLDPGWRPSMSAAAAALSIDRVSGDIIRVRRTVEDLIEVEFDCSLDRGCQIVRYHMKNLRNKHQEERVYTWEKGPDGNHVLSKLDVRSSLPVLDGTTRVHRSYHITSFDPSFRPIASTFDLSSLPLKAGTTSVDPATGRKLRNSDRPVRDVVKTLDGLGEEMRVKGFARRGR